MVLALGSALHRLGEAETASSKINTTDSNTWTDAMLPSSASPRVLAGALCGAGELLLTCGGHGSFVSVDAISGSREHLDAKATIGLDCILETPDILRKNSHNSDTPRQGASYTDGPSAATLSLSEYDREVGPVIHGRRQWYECK